MARAMAGMSELKFPKDEVLKILRQNRDKHRDVFERALVGYREAVIAELERSLSDAKAGKKIQLVSLVEPMDQTKDYDRVIKMLEMCVDTEIVLSQDDVACYIMDDWKWKDAFEFSNKTYLK